jgi:tetratricopeptide (TPR) repeat protein
MTAASHENLALVYREMGQYEKALEHAATSLELNPARPGPLLTLGITYAKMNQHSMAISYYEQAWAGGLGSVDLYNNWAVTLYTLGKVDRAISLLQKALTIDPDHPQSHYNLGIAYSSKGLLQKARQEMERAMQLQQKNYGKRF